MFFIKNILYDLVKLRICVTISIGNYIFFPDYSLFNEFEDYVDQILTVNECEYLFLKARTNIKSSFYSFHQYVVILITASVNACRSNNNVWEVFKSFKIVFGFQLTFSIRCGGIGCVI